MKIVLKNSQVIDIQGNTDALIYDTTTNTLSVDSPTLGQFVVTFDTDTQVPDIRTLQQSLALDTKPTTIKAGDPLDIVQVAQSDVPSNQATDKTRQMSDAHRRAIGEALRKTHEMRKMLDSKGNLILVHKNDFVDALQIGYQPKNSRVVLHSPTIWANRKEGQTLREMGVYFIDVVQGSKKVSAAIEKIADLIQSQKCELGYPEHFQMITSKK